MKLVTVFAVSLLTAHFAMAKPAESTAAKRSPTPTKSMQAIMDCPKDMSPVECFGWFTQKIEKDGLSASFYPDAATKAVLGAASDCDTKQPPQVFNACLVKNAKKIGARSHDCADKLDEPSFIKCMGWTRKPQTALNEQNTTPPTKAASGSGAGSR